MILAIDPGDEESAFVLVENDLSKVIDKGKLPNREFIERMYHIVKYEEVEDIAIEMIACYGMAVGKTVFDTCVFIGRLYQIFIEEWKNPTFIYRKDEKMCLCHSMKAKDTNIRQALIDRFGVVGTKKNPGYFYGFKKDIWAAMAVATAYHDKYIAEIDF